VPEVLTVCVVAWENPHVLLLQAATSLSFRFLVVMPFAGFSGIIFGESPDNYTLTKLNYTLILE
jgi:hypothetical protein